MLADGVVWKTMRWCMEPCERGGDMIVQPHERPGTIDARIKPGHGEYIDAVTYADWAATEGVVDAFVSLEMEMKPAQVQWQHISDEIDRVYAAFEDVQIISARPDVDVNVFNLNLATHCGHDLGLRYGNDRAKRHAVIDPTSGGFYEVSSLDRAFPDREAICVAYAAFRME